MNWKQKFAGPDRAMKKVSQFIGLFLLGNFLFSYPILTLFNTTRRVWGIPVFFLYFFFAWVLLIILMILSTREMPDTHLKKNHAGPEV